MGFVGVSVREPQLRTEPMVMGGHGWMWEGQRAFVMCHIVLLSRLWQPNRMCSRDSVRRSQPGWWQSALMANWGSGIPR